jgi:hypothetical protein
LHVTGLRPRLTDRLGGVVAPTFGRLTRPVAPSRVRMGLAGRLRLAWIALALLFAGLWAADWVQVAQRWDDVWAAGLPGHDYTLYMQAASRWFGGSDFYLASQLHGPYSIPEAGGAILYPPTMLILFVPFSFLPAILWWAIPLALVGWAIWVHRPGPLTWPVLAMLLWWPTTNLKLLGGNPTTLWFTAILAVATIRPAASALFVLKPTLIPFALLGARRLGWWLTLAATVAVSLPFIGLWSQYISVLLDARDPSGLLYSLHDVPTMLIPMTVWIGGRRSPLLARSSHDAVPEPEESRSRRRAVDARISSI